MSNLLTDGKLYKLKFYDKEDVADTDMFLEYMEKLSGVYKLIGNGIIPWGDEDLKKCKKFKYYLFKNRNNNIVEVFQGDNNNYYSLVFCFDTKVVIGSYTDYLKYGDLEFPEFCGNSDMVVAVDIEPTEEI